ncbi:MAG: hypothetical protein COC15_00370 [Legionellales bacterium]|nr:MAG: hypothetical protein COC15_00370 [Legionellales bacterium]
MLKQAIAIVTLSIVSSIAAADNFHKTLVPYSLAEKQELALIKASQSMQDNKLQAAIRQLEPLAPRYYNHPKRLQLLATISLKQDKPQVAIDYLLKISKQYQGNSIFVGTLAMAYYNAGLYDLALQNYNILTMQEANNHKWWLGLATSLDAKGAIQHALEAYIKTKSIGNLNVIAAQYVNKRIAELTKVLNS